MDFAMRPAVEADFDEIYVIEHASFGSTAWPKQMMATELSPNPNRNYFVALEGDRIVGYAGIGVVDGNHADVMTIAVSADQRGKGLGRALMNRLIAVAAKRGAREMFLEVRAGTGGDEAAIFAGDLFRMYSRYADARGWQVEVLSQRPGEHGGFKEVIASVAGRDVFSRVVHGGHIVLLLSLSGTALRAALADSMAAAGIPGFRKMLHHVAQYAPLKGELTVHMKVTSQSATNGVADMWFTDAQGHLVAELVGAELTLSPTLNPMFRQQTGQSAHV